MKRLETMKRLINNLLTVYSGTSQNTSLNKKIFVKDDHQSGTAEMDNSEDVSKGYSKVNSNHNLTDKAKDDLENTAKDKLILNIEEINFTLNRDVTLQDASEVSIILPKTEIKKTFYQNDKITSITEIVLSNLTIIHNPKVGAQIVSTTDNEDNSHDKPKLTIGFNTEEIEKTPP